MNRAEDAQRQLLALVEEQRRVADELRASVEALRGRLARHEPQRRPGCSVEPNADGTELTLRFRYVVDGRRVRARERTGLAPTPENVAKLQRTAELIGHELRTGRFKYEEWFPASAARKAERGKQLELGYPHVRGRSAHAAPRRHGELYARWIEEKRAERDSTPPLIRASLFAAYKQHFEDHLLPILRNVGLRGEPTRARLEAIRRALRAKELSEKTIRNVIDGTYRAFVRDAYQAELEMDPGAFERLRWPKYQPPEPQPFTEDERDRILAYFETKRWKVGGYNDAAPHHAYFAFVFTLFFTGMRPSELAAVRLEHVDLDGPAPELRIRASRHRRVESAPKTASARRSAKLTPRNVEILRALVPLKAEPSTYLFRDPRGAPIHPGNFGHLFTDAQRALGITPVRGLYTTKDTFVSWARRHRVNEAWLEDQTGVSTQTLRKHYGRHVHDPAWDAAELAKIDGDRAADRRIRRSS